MTQFFYEPISPCKNCNRLPGLKTTGIEGRVTIHCQTCGQSVTRKNEASASRAWCKQNPNPVKERRFYSFRFFGKSKSPIRIHACTHCGGFPHPFGIRGCIGLGCDRCKKFVIRASFHGAFNEWNRINPLPKEYEIR